MSQRKPDEAKKKITIATKKTSEQSRRVLLQENLRVLDSVIDQAKRELLENRQGIKCTVILEWFGSMLVKYPGYRIDEINEIIALASARIASEKQSGHKNVIVHVKPVRHQAIQDAAEMSRFFGEKVEPSSSATKIDLQQLEKDAEEWPRNKFKK